MNVVEWDNVSLEELEFSLEEVLEIYEDEEFDFFKQRVTWSFYPKS